AQQGRNLSEPFGSLREDLESVMTGLVHDGEHAPDVVEADVFVKQVAHGIDEHPARVLPPKRLGELVWLFGHVLRSVAMRPRLRRVTVAKRDRFGVAVQ